VIPEVGFGDDINDPTQRMGPGGMSLDSLECGECNHIDSHPLSCTNKWKRRVVGVISHGRSFSSAHPLTHPENIYSPQRSPKPSLLTMLSQKS